MKLKLILNLYPELSLIAKVSVLVNQFTCCVPKLNVTVPALAAVLVAIVCPILFLSTTVDPFLILVTEIELLVVVTYEWLVVFAETGVEVTTCDNGAIIPKLMATVAITNPFFMIMPPRKINSISIYYLLVVLEQTYNNLIET
ncbi:hypothetical protein [Pediococcus pentosaceus]|uniref:hypothetical protein n=1 Tax=Pediococcus pentosaceus TaxID=1255 RepID=UPI00398A8BA0